MSEIENDLRATAEDIAADSARLTGIEDEKIRLDARDPRMGELSAESEQIARRMVPKTAAERELADELATTSDPDD